MAAQHLTMKSFDNPDQVNELGKSRAEVVHFDGFTMIRMTFMPGMRYSRDIRPYVPSSHEKAPPRPVYCQSGRLHFVQPDGSAVEIRAGDAYLAPRWESAFPDSWVLGDEPCVLISFIPTKLDISQDGGTPSTG